MLIDTPESLSAALSGFAGCPWLTVDTEFVREETYWPRLCLIQIGDGEREICVDAQRIGDLSPLFELLDAAGSIKVFHAASQDLEIFVQLRGRTPTPLFDTQIAASLLGLGDQLGYAALVERRLGVKLDKSLSRTDWSRRPLSAAELAYAEEDVRQLARLYPELRAELEKRGRLAWLEEDCARLARPQRYRPQPELAWQRLKGLARLAPAAQQVAAALAEWRERLALERDRPRKWILSDEALYSLAERQPLTLDQLQALQAIPPKSFERHGQELLALIDAARARGGAALVQDIQLSPAQKSRIQKLLNRVREIAAKLEVPAGLLGPRADVEALALQGESAAVPLLTGWRREVAGAELLALA